MSKTQSGFTLIELVMVIVILGILAAVAVPRFVDLGTDARAAAILSVNGGVKSGHAVAVADLKGLPELNQLAAQIDGGIEDAADFEGILTTIDGTVYITQTYTDSACLAANITAATDDVVSCVGSTVVK